MRVLLDECLPRRLGSALAGYEVSTVPETGWSGKKNGELLDLADAIFDVLITIDQGFASAKGMTGHKIAVITLRSVSNRLADLRPLVPQLLDALALIQPGQAVRVPD